MDNYNCKQCGDTLRKVLEKEFDTCESCIKKALTILYFV